MRQVSVRLTRPYRLQNPQLDHTRRSVEERSHGSPRSQGTARLQMGLGPHRRPSPVPADRRSSSRLPQLAQEPTLRSGGLRWTPHHAKLSIRTPLHDSFFRLLSPQSTSGPRIRGPFLLRVPRLLRTVVLNFEPPPGRASAVATVNVAAARQLRFHRSQC
jgi:hypothetical protein